MRLGRPKNELYFKSLYNMKVERAQERQARNRFKCDVPDRECARCGRNFKPIGKCITRCDTCKTGDQFEVVELSRAC